MSAAAQKTQSKPTHNSLSGTSCTAAKTRRTPGCKRPAHAKAPCAKPRCDATPGRPRSPDHCAGHVRRPSEHDHLDADSRPPAKTPARSWAQSASMSSHSRADSKPVTRQTPCCRNIVRTCPRGAEASTASGASSSGDIKGNQARPLRSACARLCSATDAAGGMAGLLRPLGAEAPPPSDKRAEATVNNSSTRRSAPVLAEVWPEPMPMRPAAFPATSGSAMTPLAAPCSPARLHLRACLVVPAAATIAAITMWL
mmetsp:Transcript_31881/g.91869  ORF Transcript_31881/g.91869 Transcript_31881/m.91869 type:complete len:255 (-) Transcript_31881:37-801(-)